MILKTDCKHFPGDRPCKPSKELGIDCNECSFYSPVRYKILIVKLDAIGDVLRTTSILHGLKKKYPDSQITWLTKKNSSEIFINNTFIDRIFEFESPDLNAHLLTEEFDVVINPDSSPVTASLASISKSKVKKGFVLDKLGCIHALNKSAEEWLEMGAFDKLKKANIKSYQQIIHDICELDFSGGEIILNLNEKELEFKQRFIENNNLRNFDFFIGLNTGASKRWQLKQWHLESYLKLIERLLTHSKTAVLLFGGEDEKSQNEYIKSVFPSVIDTGSNNSLREFFSLMDIPNIVVTGDTLALHAATALKKQVVCLFGPTSSAEIYDYGRITKIFPEIDCLVCYKNECDFNPNCMDLITVEMVYRAVVDKMTS
jgi:heptosyltransferase-2